MTEQLQLQQNLIKFYTIEKQEFNYFSQKLQNKKYKLYAKINNTPIFPPTWKSIHKQQTPLQNNTTKQKWFVKNTTTEADKIKFADNILLQEEILRIIKKRREEFSYTCWIIKLQTWKWKSMVCMDIIEYLQDTTLILVSNLKLMQEMIDKFALMTNITPSQYWWWKKEIWYITIMTKSSFLIAQKEELEDFDCILVDELQTWFSDLFIEKMNITYKDNWNISLYWLSATPYTQNLTEEDMEKYYWKIIEPHQKYDFIPNFTFFNYYHLNDYEFEMYHELKQSMIENEDRKQKQEESILDNLSSRCSLILCDRLEEIKNWEKLFFEYSYKYYYIVITWETKIADDKIQLEEALKQDKPIVIIGSIQKVATWFDYPIIDTVFIYSSIKFESTVIQAVGRCLRKANNKTKASVYVWNDKILDKQRQQKQKAIKDEYWIDSNNINVIEINKQRKDKWIIELIF